MAEDKICLEGMVFYGYHGVKAAEKELGQRFVVDLEVTADLHEAAASDDIARTINYSELYRLTRSIMEGPSRNLLESVAEKIASEVLARYPLAEAVRIRIRKPAAPIAGSVLNSASVEVVRRR